MDNAFPGDANNDFNLGFFVENPYCRHPQKSITNIPAGVGPGGITDTYASQASMPQACQPDATSLSNPSRKFVVWLVAGVLLTNLVIILIGTQSLIYCRERTVEQVRNTTSNLAALLAQNIGDSGRRIDLALLSIVDAL